MKKSVKVGILRRKVSMSEVVSQRQSRAAKRVVKKAVLESIKDQAQMSKRARECYQ